MQAPVLGSPEPTVHSCEMESTGVDIPHYVEAVLENIIKDAFLFLGYGTLGDGNADIPTLIIEYTEIDTNLRIPTSRTRRTCGNFHDYLQTLVITKYLVFSRNRGT